MRKQGRCTGPNIGFVCNAATHATFTRHLYRRRLQILDGAQRQFKYVSFPVRVGATQGLFRNRRIRSQGTGPVLKWVRVDSEYTLVHQGQARPTGVVCAMCCRQIKNLSELVSDPKKVFSYLLFDSSVSISSVNHLMLET